MRLIDADKFKCILPCNDQFHHIINHARTVKAIPCKDIEKMRAEIANLDNLNPIYLSDGRYTVDKFKVLEIIDKYMAEDGGEEV